MVGAPKRNKFEQYGGFLKRLQRTLPGMQEDQKIELAVSYSKSLSQTEKRNLQETSSLYYQAKNMVLNDLSPAARNKVYDRLFEMEQEKKLKRWGFGNVYTDDKKRDPGSTSFQGK